MDIDPVSRDLAIRTMIGEVDPNDPDTGRAAVAATILNRAKAGSYGKNPAAVVLSRDQFEPWQRNPRALMAIDPNGEEYQHAAKIFDGVAAGTIPDPTGGATHFYSPAGQAALGRRPPNWSQGQPTAVIGGHRFYAPQGVSEAQPNLLGEWGAEPQNQPQSASQPAAGSLLDEWATPAEPATPEPTGRPDLPHIIVTPQNAPLPAQSGTQSTSQTAPAEEPPGLAVARLLSQSQGPGIGNALARAGLGAVRGIMDVPATLVQGAAAVGNELGATDWAAGVNARVARDMAAFAPYDIGLAGAGRIGGQVAATGPVLGAAAAPLEAVPYAGSLLGGAATGAGAAGLTAAASNLPADQQIGAGAVAGGILGPAGALVSRAGAALAGSVDPYVARLAQAARDQFGINLSASQISQNPMIRFADSMLQRIPFTGYGARTAQQKTQFANALASEMGTSADRITPDVVQSNLKSLGRDYQAWDAKVGSQPTDVQFYTELKNIADDAVHNLEDSKAKIIGRQITNVLGKVDVGAQTIEPEQYRALTRHGGLLDNAINSEDGWLSGYATKIKNSLENLVGRNDPALKAEKDEIDYKYAITKALEKTANKSPTGDLQPKSVFNAIAAGGYSNPATELGRVGQLFLSEPPSSGTAERLLSIGALGKIATGAIAGGLGYGAVHEFDPEDMQSSIAKLGMGAAGLAALRYGVSPALRSKLLANRVIANSLGGGQPVSNFLAGAPTALGALTARNALTNRPASP